MKQVCLTRNRQLVADYIKGKEIPLSAPALVQELSEYMDQATVYRSLSFLQDNGLVESFIFDCSRDGTLRYYVASSTESHIHYFHCERCHRFYPLEHCNMSFMSTVAGNPGFKILSHTVYYRGICGECRETGEQ